MEQSPQHLLLDLLSKKRALGLVELDKDTDTRTAMGIGTDTDTGRGTGTGIRTGRGTGNYMALGTDIGIGTGTGIGIDTGICTDFGNDTGTDIGTDRYSTDTGRRTEWCRYPEIGMSMKDLGTGKHRRVAGSDTNLLHPEIGSSNFLVVDTHTRQEPGSYTPVALGTDIDTGTDTGTGTDIPVTSTGGASPPRRHGR